MKLPETCLKCGGRMEEGFVLDQSHAYRFVAKWIAGKPEASFFMGVKIDGREQHEIRSYRCIACGFLESYAPGSCLPTLMNDGFQFLVFLAVIALAACSISWHFSRSRSVLETWADEHGFEIVRSEYCHFRRGPFFWTTSKGQSIYYVTVRDRSGRVRTGWVRCGGFFMGLFPDAAEVRWED